MKKLIIIVGKRGNLSFRLSKLIKNSLLISTEEFINNKYDLKNLENKKICLIINSFYPSNKLNHINNHNEYIEQTVSNLVKILDRSKKLNVFKIIYSSSSSIYNLQKTSATKLETSRDLYALTKLFCEKLIIKFAKKNKKEFIITRLYNLFGEKDNFSIISKIIDSYKKKKIFQLNNNGDAIRDFIHVDEVARIYLKLVEKKYDKIIDIGCGYGYQIGQILSSIGFKNFIIRKKFLIEQKISISSKSIFQYLKIKENSNLSLKNFLIRKLNIKNNIDLKKKYFDDKINFHHEIFGSIIFGAGDAGKQVCNLIQKKNKNGVFCFVDDNKKLIDKSYNGVKIISKKKLKQISKEYLIPNIIIAIPSLKNDKLVKLSNELYNYSASVYNLPSKNEYNTDQILLSDIQNSEFLNIFSRDEKRIKNNTFKKLENKKILVTGAGGSIGSELVRQLVRIKGTQIICLDISELFLYNLKNNISSKENKIKFILGSVTDSSLLKDLFKKQNIDLIYHAAAYKHLNFLEENPLQGVKNNILGTLNLIENSILYSKKKIKMINISTDKAVRPESILGISKRIAEIICENFRFNFKKNIEISTVRFGNVFGSMGSAINLFLDRINKGEDINITSKKAERYFMSVNQACNLVIVASLFNDKYKTYIFDMGKPLNIFHLVTKLINKKKMSNKNFRIKIKEVGLNKGEKVKEELSLNNKLKKTNSSKIYEVNENKYNQVKVINLIRDIKLTLKKENEKKLIFLLRKFLNSEYKLKRRY